MMSRRHALSSWSIGSDPYAAWKDSVVEGTYKEYVNKGGDTYAVKYPFIEHFPDGNATLARSLVKKMIPNIIMVLFY